MNLPHAPHQKPQRYRQQQHLGKNERHVGRLPQERKEPDCVASIRFTRPRAMTRFVSSLEGAPFGPRRRRAGRSNFALGMNLGRFFSLAPARVTRRQCPSALPLRGRS